MGINILNGHYFSTVGLQFVALEDKGRKEMLMLKKCF